MILRQFLKKRKDQVFYQLFKNIMYICIRINLVYCIFLNLMLIVIDSSIIIWF